MSSTYGEQLKLSIFGQSHGPAIGMTLDDIPAGLPVDFEQLQSFLNRRAPGQADFTTARKEEDTPQFLSGIVNGYTETSFAPDDKITREQLVTFLYRYAKYANGGVAPAVSADAADKAAA